jgi:ketosteroid isomerase-like protein
VEIVRQFIAAFIEVDEGLVDLQRLAEFYAPDGTFDLLAYSGWPGQTTFRGLDEFLKFRASWMEPYDDWSYEAKEILDAGASRVVVTFHQRGRPRDSDSWVEMDYSIVYTVEGGLIRRAKVYATPEEALEAVGLSEQDAHADS